MSRSRSSRKGLLLALLLGMGALGGCVNFIGSPDAGPAQIVIQPAVSGVAVGTSITFTASGAADTSQAVWNFNGTAATSSGAFTPATGPAVVYTAPATPPLYPGDSDPLVQGTVTLRALLVGNSAATVTFHVTAPTVTAVVSPSTATVGLGTSVQFYGYAVGAVNNGVTFQVNGVTGGSAQVGTIDALGHYTAPATMPISGKNVTLTLISNANPTVTATAAITLQ